MIAVIIREGGSLPPVRRKSVLWPEIYHKYLSCFTILLRSQREGKIREKF
jgi:hypothetical protein